MKLANDYSPTEVNVMVVYIRAIIVAFGGLFYGYNNGSFNTTQQHICYVNGWISAADQSLYTGLITSALPLGCLIGSLISAGFLKVTRSDYRLCLIITDIIGILGILEMILDYNLGHYLLGRLLAGIAGGLNTSIVPSYLQNFSPLIMRGKTGTFVQTFAQLGAFISLSFGVIQPKYATVPKDVNKEMFIAQEVSQLENFDKEGAWRLTIGFPIIICSIRLISLLFVYTQATPIQMAQQHQWKSLKKLLAGVYTKERAHKRYLEVLEYAKQVQNDNAPLPDQENPPDEYELELLQKKQQNQADEEAQLANKDQRLLTEAQQVILPTQANLNENLPMIKMDSSPKKQSSQGVAAGSRKGSEVVKQGFQESAAIAAEKAKIEVKPQNNRSAHRRLVLGMVVQTASQASGLNALMFFSKSIFQAQSSDPNVVQTYLFIQGAAGFVFTFMSMFFIEKFGRKKILIFSTSLTIIAQLGIAIFALLDIFIISFISIIFFLLAFGIGLGGVTWPFIAELVNKNQVSLCSATRWIWALIIGITFKFMVDGIGISGTFFVYCGATFLCLLYFIKEMKETKGLSIEQVDALYASEAFPAQQLTPENNK